MYSSEYIGNVPPSEHLPHPVGYINLPNKDFTDGPWGLRYRTIGQHAKTQDWYDMPTICDALSVSDDWIVNHVKRGKIACAMFEGSDVPMFRILDRSEIIRQAIMEPPVPASKPNRKKATKL